MDLLHRFKGCTFLRITSHTKLNSFFFLFLIIGKTPINSFYNISNPMHSAYCSKHKYYSQYMLWYHNISTPLRKLFPQRFYIPHALTKCNTHHTPNLLREVITLLPPLIRFFLKAFQKYKVHI